MLSTSNAKTAAGSLRAAISTEMGLRVARSTTQSLEVRLAVLVEHDELTVEYYIG